MVFKQMLEVYDILDDIHANGDKMASYLRSIKGDAEIQVKTIQGDKGKTDLIKITIPGICGRTRGGDAPTLGIIGRLGGLGARPERIGFVSDGDGALTVLTAAAKLLDMQNKMCIRDRLFDWFHVAGYSLLIIFFTVFSLSRFLSISLMLFLFTVDFSLRLISLLFSPFYRREKMISMTLPPFIKNKIFSGGWI